MNKLTEIKQCVYVLNHEMTHSRGTFCTAEDKVQAYGLEWIEHLLSLLEEKDKALQSAEWSIEHMLREQPNELWTEQECGSWESFGKDSLKEIKAALSSNNKGEI